VVALHAAGAAHRAERIARELASSPSASPPGRRALALVARAAGFADLAKDIAAGLADPSTAPLRAEAALGAGRYRDALAEAERGLAAGAPGARQVRELARGHVTVRSSGWLPSLGEEAAGLARINGRPTRGRVLHLVSRALPHTLAGYTVRTQDVATSQAAAGLDPHVMTRAGFPRKGSAGGPGIDWVGPVPYHRVPESAPSKVPDRMLTEVVRAAVPLLVELRPAVLQPASNHLQAQTALALAEPLGIPVVYEVRGFWEESWAADGSHDEEAAMATDHYLMTRAVETACMLAVSAVVTLSDVMRDAIVERGVPPERITVVPNAVDVDRFRPVPRDAALAASLGIEADELVVGYISTFTAYEGIPTLLEAAARLRATGRRLRVLLVGDGKEEATIRAAGMRLGLFDEGALLMPGRVSHDQIARYYSLLDVFVVPRTANRVSQLVTPLKPYEAMAMERAVVVSDTPALREIVTPGETGLAFRPDDVDDLVEVLAALLDDATLRKELGLRAREWVAQERTWAANGRRYRELFERLDVA
jgi:glycosyltransferase involved in cell wall biosynthesis